MLILTRRIGEKVVIGDGITVEIMSIVGNKVRVGVEAPIEVAVHRQEVHDAIQRDRLDAIAAGNGPEIHGRTEFPPHELGEAGA